MKGSPLLLLSGIPAGPWGTGRLVAHIEQEIARRHLPCQVIAKPERRHRDSHLQSAREFIRYNAERVGFRLRLSRALADESRPLLILHPQTLGFQFTMGILERRRLPTALYLLDSSFFCIVSYNHLRGETGPCLRCLGGNFNEALANRCLPFPKPDPAATIFVQRLRNYVADGRIVLIAQTARQAELASEHFRLADKPPVVGLWTVDWDGIFEDPRQIPDVADGWDVVFHGYNLPAKGASWVEDVAGRLPSRRFLFPFAPSKNRQYKNCEYRPMTWESGLESAIRSSAITIVPSLWSAPIEGALVKSIALARATAVVENHSAYEDELPQGLVLRLPPDPDAAAQVLDSALQRRWQPDLTIKRSWLHALGLQRVDFLSRLLASVPGISSSVN